ncbi:MAG: hypothetical protein KF712_02100 [Akkermansiaceae bacterium]|nr:hypothetical protein [Akkermansiaceae bacterium]
MNSGAISAKAILLSLGTLAASVLTSIAQTVPNPVANDIFLGFRIDGQPDGYITRLGNYTTYFRDIPEGATVTLSVTGIGADLSAKYGPNWSENPNARWGIFGSNFAGNGPLLFASRERTATSTATSPWPALRLDLRELVNGNINAVLQLTGGYRGRTATANNAVGTFQPPPTSSDGFESNYIHQTSPGVDFGPQSGWEIEGDFANGPNSTVLDLYRVGGESTLRVGYFTITSSGTVSFTRQSTATPPVVDADTDGDGILDSLEDIAGTSKTDPTDFFRVQGTTLTGNHPAFAFKPAANRTYKLFYSETLLAGSWQEITAASPAPPTTIARYVTNGTPPASFSFSDQDPVRREKNKGFYRIEVSLNP